MSEARRDRWGRYMVVPPNGGKPVGYTRATTIAKTLDSGDGLLPWKATATMVGALRSPGLHARWQALVSEHPDPWYANDDARKACKRLVEECATAGGSTSRSDLGTALHAITEQVDLGGTPILLPQMAADIEAYRTTLDAHNITFDRHFVEATVVLDEHQVAGTADRLAADVPGHGLLVADLKTGDNLTYSWPGISVQMSAYARANNVYRQGSNPDGSEDQRHPMPELNTSLGLVIHLPAGSATCTLHLVDLDAGWEAFQRSMWTRAWRARKSIARPLTGEITTWRVGKPTKPAKVRDAQQGQAPADASVTSAGAALAPTAPVVVSHGATTVEQGAKVAGGVLGPPATTPTPAEGDQVTAEAIDLIKSVHGRLSDTAKALVGQLLTEAERAGVPWHMSARVVAVAHNGPVTAPAVRTVRRAEITRGVVTVLDGGDTNGDTLDVLHALAALTTGTTDTTATVGAVLGHLDHTTAQTFARHCDSYVAGHLTATFDFEGRLRLTEAAQQTPTNSH